MLIRNQRFASSIQWFLVFFSVFTGPYNAWYLDQSISAFLHPNKKKYETNCGMTFVTLIYTHSKSMFTSNSPNVF